MIGGKKQEEENVLFCDMLEISVRYCPAQIWCAGNGKAYSVDYKTAMI